MSEDSIDGSVDIFTADGWQRLLSDCKEAIIAIVGSALNYVAAGRKIVYEMIHDR